jgi:ATP-dependent helicase/nuclease subunit A
MPLNSEVLPTENATLKLQQSASDPSLSVWVAASAGSGKTKVLTDRVLRLLLSGALPNRILCLTFTKAAAAEMSTRIARRLSEWSLATDAELARDLEQLSGKSIKVDDLTWARRLFATVLDSPGGLQVQTIHGFCQSILRRFPLEAGLSPQFDVLDERTAKERMRTARDAVISASKINQLSSVLGPLNEISERASESTVSELIDDLLSERSKLQTAVRSSDGVNALCKIIKKELGLQEDETQIALLNECISFTEFERAELRIAALALASGRPTDTKNSLKIIRCLEIKEPTIKSYHEYLSVFLTQQDEIRARLATQEVIKKNEAVFDILNLEAQRVQKLQKRMKSLDLAIRTEALVKLSYSVLNSYEKTKNINASIDYDDLIFATYELLQQVGIASWVLFKLDGGIDHLLIDEAQDTNPEQWKIIEKLTDEFFSLKGGAEVQSGALRTVFAVGDIKQSIFSFQRADPQSFLDMSSKLAKRVRMASGNWRGIKLDMSFRSTSAVLNAVDTVFNFKKEDGPAGWGVLEEKQKGEFIPMRHQAHRKGQEGCVELWPLELPDQSGKPNTWVLPLEQKEYNEPSKRLAQKIASKINNWLTVGEIIKSKGRPIRPADIMILVRTRGKFVNQLVRALKELEIDVAGVDRMMLTDQLPIMDLVALGQFLLLPDDDLNLAIVLKGPLIGLDEEELLSLCWDRKEESLWAELSKRALTEDNFLMAHTFLSAWIKRADFMPPYELFSELLCLGGRKKITERLGLEANDPLDEFLTQAIEFERVNIPSLQGFLHWLASADFEVKRDLETSQADQVRILTVHSSKGLQAPIVFLPDTISPPHKTPSILWKETSSSISIPFWAPNKQKDNSITSLLREKAIDKRDREYRRLLYVAMTRAEDRLYVCGWETKKNTSELSWYKMIESSLTPLAEKYCDKITFKSPQSEPPDDKSQLELSKVSCENLPKWAISDVSELLVGGVSIKPSKILESNSTESLLGNSHSKELEAGKFIHYLLEHLPQVKERDREAYAKIYLAQPIHRIRIKDQREYIMTVLRVLDNRHCESIFSPEAITEAPISGNLVEDGKEYKVSGRIDRLLINDHEIKIVDFKTNKVIPSSPSEIPDSYKKQLAIYYRLVRQIYPTHQISCIILWVDKPMIMELVSNDMESMKIF